MRKLTIFIIVPILFACIAGCSSIRSSLVTISEEDLKNVEAGRTIGENGLKVWAWNYGFIVGGLGEAKLQTLPAEALAAMLSIKQVAIKWGYWDEKDYDLAFALGSKIRATSVVTQEVLKVYAPNVLEYIPALLKMVP